MISQYDLYDISQCLILLRKDICFAENIQILDAIIPALKNNAAFEENQIRKAIAKVPRIDVNVWEFAFVNNYSLFQRFLHNDSIYVILTKALDELKRLLKRKEYSQAYDLVDSIHCLPKIIADCNFVIPQDYWNIYLQQYRDKWDSNFLIKEQQRY